MKNPFRIKPRFPKWYIGLLLFTFAFIFLDATALKIASPDEPFFDPETAQDIGRSLGMIVIWVPYRMDSERVKATFVR